MDKLLHLPTLGDWEAIREDATAFAAWRQTIEERVNRIEKRMDRLEKLANRNGRKEAAKRIDRRDRETV